MAYSDDQYRRDLEWRAAWENMPAEQRAELERAMSANSEYPVERSQGAVVHEVSSAPAEQDGRMSVGREDDATVLCEMHPDFAHWPDLAGSLDTIADELIEQHGLTPAVAKAVAAECERRVKLAEMQAHSLLLGRMAGFLMSGTENPLARNHALLHAIPALARLNGVRSMRHSAELCREAGFPCTVEWISRLRARWCALLGVPVPAESTKSEAARQKYSQDKKQNHWRHQKCKASPAPKE